MPRRLLIECLAMVGNTLAFFVAFFVGLRLVYGVVFTLLDLGRIGPGVEPVVDPQYAMVGSIMAVFVAVGAVAVMWTRHVVSVLIPAAGMFLLGMLMIA